jgi:hypothetical protein
VLLRSVSTSRSRDEPARMLMNGFLFRLTAYSTSSSVLCKDTNDIASGQSNA